jgi:hypothetical protein
MRVVNNVEREMMRAEWGNWLLDENTRCKQVHMMLKENRTNISPARKITGVDSQKILTENTSRMDQLRRWHEDYCGSCKIEQELLLEGKKHLAFG